MMKRYIVTQMIASLMAKGINKMVAILTVKDYTDYSLEEIIEIAKEI